MRLPVGFELGSEAATYSKEAEDLAKHAEDENPKRSDTGVGLARVFEAGYP